MTCLTWRSPFNWVLKWIRVLLIMYPNYWWICRSLIFSNKLEDDGMIIVLKINQIGKYKLFVKLQKIWRIIFKKNLNLNLTTNFIPSGNIPTIEFIGHPKRHGRVLLSISTLFKFILIDIHISNINTIWLYTEAFSSTHVWRLSVNL